MKMLNGLVVVKGMGKYFKNFESGKPAEKTKKDFAAIPYYAWVHRGKVEMMVLINRNFVKMLINH